MFHNISEVEKWVYQISDLVGIRKARSLFQLI